MAKIKLVNMEFHAYHGCLEHEQTQGNTFLVSLGMELNTDEAEITDNLDHTLNYQIVYNLVKNEMEIPSKLIEHVSNRIIERVFDSFKQIKKIEIELSKLNPPLGAKVEKVTIEQSRTRK